MYSQGQASWGYEYGDAEGYDTWEYNMQQMGYQTSEQEMQAMLAMQGMHADGMTDASMAAMQAAALQSNMGDALLGQMQGTSAPPGLADPMQGQGPMQDAQFGGIADGMHDGMHDGLHDGMHDGMHVGMDGMMGYDSYWGEYGGYDENADAWGADGKLLASWEQAAMPTSMKEGVQDRITRVHFEKTFDTMDELLSKHPNLVSELLKCASEHLAPGFCSLDIGCAPGGFSSRVLTEPGCAGASGVTLPEKDGGYKVLLQHPSFDLQYSDALAIGVDDVRAPDVELAIADAQDLTVQRDQTALARGMVRDVSKVAQKREGDKALGIWRLTLAELGLGLSRLRRGGALIFRFGFRSVFRKEDAWYVFAANHMIALMSRIFAHVRMFKSENFHVADSTFYMVCTGRGQGSANVNVRSRPLGRLLVWYARDVMTKLSSPTYLPRATGALLQLLKVAADLPATTEEAYKKLSEALPDILDVETLAEPAPPLEEELRVDDLGRPVPHELQEVFSWMPADDPTTKAEQALSYDILTRVDAVRQIGRQSNAVLRGLTERSLFLSPVANAKERGLRHKMARFGKVKNIAIRPHDIGVGADIMVTYERRAHAEAALQGVRQMAIFGSSKLQAVLCDGKWASVGLEPPPESAQGKAARAAQEEGAD